MKYAKHIPKTDLKLRDGLLNNGWKQIKEPSNLFFAFLFSIPFMLINGLVSNSVFSLFGHSILQVLPLESFSIQIRLDYLIFTYLIIIFHEIIHLILIPNFLKSENTFFGIKPWGGFVFTQEKIERNRYILISIAPFVIISICMPFIFGILNLLSGITIFLALINALASSIDALTAFLIYLKVPSDGLVVSNGFETYYYG
jgi:hypothetical protein